MPIDPLSASTLSREADAPEPRPPGPSEESPADTPASPPGVPYRRLSDEVLERIFEELHSLFQSARTRVPPLRYLFLSKRVYNRARPIWLSAISTKGSSSTAGSDRLLAKLVTDPTIRPLVRSLEMTFFRAFAQTQIAILTLLDNLRCLKVSFDESWQQSSSGAKIIPAALLDAIASRPHLEQLSFCQLVEAKYPFPQPVNNRPLQSFTAAIPSLRGPLLKYLTARRVKTLRLAVLLNHEAFFGALPWAELTMIDFNISVLQNGRPATCDVPETLGRQVRANIFSDSRLVGPLSGSSCASLSCSPAALKTRHFWTSLWLSSRRFRVARPRARYELF